MKENIYIQKKFKRTECSILYGISSDYAIHNAIIHFSSLLKGKVRGLASYIHFYVKFFTAGFLKTVPSVYPFVMNTSLLQRHLLEFFLTKK